MYALQDSTNDQNTISGQNYDDWLFPVVFAHIFAKFCISCKYGLCPQLYCLSALPLGGYSVGLMQSAEQYMQWSEYVYLTVQYGTIKIDLKLPVRN